MKYKLINKQTGETHLCDKVEIGEFDYYYDRYDCKKIIATTNPNTDCPKVVDEVENIAYKWFVKANKKDAIFGLGWVNIFKGGYNKAKETYSNSDEDTIEFAEWLDNNKQQREYHPMSSMNHKELLQLWREQKPKNIWYA